MKKGWVNKKLGGLCEVGRGSSPRPINDQKYFEGGKIPWIKIADATKSGKYLYKTKQYVNEYGASFSRLLKKGSLIMATSGTLGYTIFLGVRGCIHDGWLYMSNFNGIEKNFLFYYLKNNTKYFYNRAYGAAIQNVNTDILRSLPLDLPPLEVQREIATILSNYDNLIENNTKRIEILEKIAKLIYDEWFVKFKFPGHEKVKMVDSAFGKIPEGWKVKCISSLCDINKLSIKPDNAPKSIKYVDIRSVKEGKINEIRKIEFKNAPGRARRIVRNGDIIWSGVRPNLRAYALVLHPPQNLIASTGFIVISPTNIPYSFAYNGMIMDKFVQFLVNVAKGAAYPAVSPLDLGEHKIILPPDGILNKFDNICNRIYENVHQLKEKNIWLQKTRDLLLPKLISGQVDVSNLDIKVPEVVV